MAVIYRSYGSKKRRRMAHKLARVCERRRLRLFIALDVALAAEVGAAGVHLPELAGRLAPKIKADRPDWIVTVAAHSAEALAMAAAFGADAALLSKVYPSRSASPSKTLTLEVAGKLARWASLPVIAMGGVKLSRMQELARAGFAGAAGVELFSRPGGLE